MFQSLYPAFSKSQRLEISQQIYDWLIKPIEEQLVAADITTLVFVLDGTLRNLPMAALYDGEQYLLQKYKIAIAPGMQLLAPRSLSSLKFKSLTAGLSEARSGFNPLPGVDREVEQISTIVDAKVLLNDKFTNELLAQQLNNPSFPIVHLATHGQFSSKPEETFLLTWDGQLNVNQLSRLFKERELQGANPIELLVLSACQTASGDSRATLGLAGLAVRSGVRSTLASLWSVSDRSTADLTIEFYQQLKQLNGDKAEALRQAQLSLLQNPEYQHPYYWSPFVLIGNWL